MTLPSIMLALTASALLTPLEHLEQPLVLIDEKRIVEVTSRQSRELPRGARVVELGDAVLAPGFVDIHNHGGAGHDVMEADPAALPAIEALLFRHGVTGYLPTTVTAPLDRTLEALQRLADAIETAEKSENAGAKAKPLGIHIEGPFLSHVRRGVHPPDDLLPPTIETFDKLWQAARGHIRLMTIAPELDGALDLIKEAVRRGVTVSIGHSDADFKTAFAAVDAGAPHATQPFHALRPFSPRGTGTISERLTGPRLMPDV